MQTLLTDIRYAVRAIAKAPGFSAIVIVVLALGIGVNTTMFISANAVLFRPFPYQNPDELVAVLTVDTRANAAGSGSFSFPDYYDVRAEAKSFTAMAAHDTRSYNLAAPGAEPERVEGERISATMFGLLGIRPAIGRDFRADEDQPGGPAVVILGDGLWRRRFAADSAIVGKAILLNGASYTVVGVMPERFAFPADQQLWTLLQLPAADERGGHFLDVIARLKPGVNMAQAQVELAGIMRRLEVAYPASNTNAGADLATLRENEVGDTQSVVWIMMGAVGFVLLIACANVANLMLAKATARRREIAVRTALGASRSRIVRQLLTESLILAALGALGGILIALWGNDLVRSALPADTPWWMRFTIDWRVLTFTALVAVGTGLLFGLAPALAASRTDLNENLKEGGQGAGSSRGRQRVRGLLVVAEVALSLVLLIGAGLMTRSFMAIQRADPGFDKSNVLTLNLYLAGPAYDSVQARTGLLRDVLAQVAAIPGVRATAASHILPLTRSHTSTDIEAEGQQYRRGEEPHVDLRVVYGDLNRTLGIPIVKGRALTAGDVTDSTYAALINQTMAARVWPGEEAVGKRFRMAGDSGGPVYTVAGVVGDIRGRRLTDPPENQLYMAYTGFETRTMVLSVKTEGDPLALVPAVRRAIRDRDALLPVFDVAAMDAVFDRSFWDKKLYGALFASFAAIALLLASVGLYAVIAYSVAQRTREIGVRMALGADSRRVLSQVVGQGASLTGAGLAIGLVASLGVTRVLRGLLYGVSPTDPVVFGGVATLLAVIALVACLVPARRAARIDPMAALRSE